MMKAYTLTLTEPEWQALAGLIDAGVRATGIRSVKDAAAILTKMEASAEEPDKALEGDSGEDEA